MIHFQEFHINIMSDLHLYGDLANRHLQILWDIV